MAVYMELTPKIKRAPGESCCEPVVYPDVEREEAVRMASVAKALADPVRVQLVDVLRKHAGKVRQVRETVRQKYAAAAVAAAASRAACCGPAEDAGLWGASLYAGSGERDAPEAAINASLGCGVPTAVADLHEGETVLDLGLGRRRGRVDLRPTSRPDG